jgi:orotate phosphoribosyltransferase
MLTSDEVLQIFRDSGALLDGHFLLTSGRHSAQYVEKFQVLQYPHLTSRLCAEFARRFANDDVQVVVGPATGGIILAHETGRQMGLRALFTEREDGRMTFRRGFVLQPGERVLVVEDIVTTGGSVVEVLQTVREHGGAMVGVGLLADRSGGRVDFGVRTEALTMLNIPTFAPEACPLCQAGAPLTKRGSRK